MILEADKLKAFCPAALPYLGGLQYAAGRFQINTALRLRHWLTQCAFESLGFTRLSESMSYSKAETIAAVFRRYVDLDRNGKISPAELAFAQQYVKQPEKLGNYVYAGRNGNGDVASGDGYRNRGFGPIQLTGVRNQMAYSQYRYGDDRVVRDPSLLTRDPDAGISAGWFWHVNGLNRYADADNLVQVSGLINTGSIKGIAHGLDDGDRSDLDSRADWLARGARIWR